MRKQHRALAALPTKRKLLLKEKQPGSDGETNVHGIKSTYAETVWRHTHTNAHTPTYVRLYVQGGSNMTGTDLYVNKPHCAAAVRP